MNRRECLTAAAAAVCGRREADYGTPEDNFSLIAQLWSAYLGRSVTPVDVSMMMSLLKIARVRNGNGQPTSDCFVDLAGYAACACEIQSNKK